MTDPGWDIPGVPRDAPADADATASTAAASSPRRGKSGRSARAGSVSASEGWSAGAFAPLAGSNPPPWPGSAASAWRGSTAAAPTAAAGDTSTPDTGSPSTRSRTDSDSNAGPECILQGRAIPSGILPADAIPSGILPADAIPSSTEPGVGSPGARVTDPVQALALLSAALDFLAHGDAGEWAEGVQADCLRALAVAESQQTAAHARVLRAFSVPGGGLAGDGHRSPRVWLTWQTSATRRAASAKVSWMHRLAAHPVVAAALAAAAVSVSWGQQIMDWTRTLPDHVRDDADGELLAAAAAGASLTDLALIAQELHREHAEPDDDGDDGFTDRGLRLVTTFGGAGRLEADLTPKCSAAAGAVLGALSQPFGPEDTRTAAQRQHDALEEAMLRLLAADGMLPQRAGQPVRLELDITLDQLANGGTGSPAGPGSACDAVIQPVITGMVDSELLARL